ncbi:MAG: hypothetical protein R3B09_30150 [Nannocystaceae bacterium]
MNQRVRAARVLGVVAAAMAVIACAAGPAEAPSTCPIDQVQSSPPPADAAARCRIVGDGSAGWSHAIALYAARDDASPVLILRHPDRVGVTWSELPPPTEGGRGARAQVELGGQRRVRARGYATLGDAVFQLRRRVDVVPGHLWHRAGAEVTVIGEDAGGVVIEADGLARAQTPGRVHVPCDALAYEGRRLADDPADAPRSDGVRLYPTRDVLSLAAEPGGCAFVALHTRFGVDLHEVERRGAFVRIAGGEALVHDGWVRAGDVQREPVDFDREFSTPTDDVDRCTLTATVAADTPLRVGATPTGPAVAELEVGAALHLPRGVDAATLEGGDAWVVVEFDDQTIVAPSGALLWAPRSAIVVESSSTRGCPDVP